RSHPYNLYHSCLPFVVLAMVGLKTWFDMAVKTDRLHRVPARLPHYGVPLVVAGCAIAHVAFQAGFQDYPNALHPAVEREGPALTLAGTGIPLVGADRSGARDFRLVTDDAKRLTQAGVTVFFLVNNDPAYYLAS